MRRTIPLCMILGLLMSGVNSASSQEAENSPHIDLDLARLYFQEALSISDRDGGALWGIELYGPLLFVDRATRFIVANRSDGENNLTPSGELFTGRLPDSVGIANTSTTWSGVEWTMLIWPLPDDAGTRKQLLAHEMFHRIQDDLMLGLGMPDNRHLDGHDGRLWMRLEWRALKVALETKGDDRREAISHALQFRAVRQSLYPNQKHDELNLELNEGLAEYTGIKAGRYSIQEQFQAAIDGLDKYDQHPNFVRSFAYASGPAYGLLIDKMTDPQWRTKLNEQSDLGEILARAYAIDLPGNPEELARERWSAYQGSIVLQEENERHQAALELQASFKARFEDNPTLTLPLNSFPNYTFNPNAIKAYGDVGSVYLTTRVVSDWGILTVTHGGALFVQSKDGGFLRIVVPAPSSPPKGQSIAGDGYTLQLKEGWSLHEIQSSGDFEARESDSDRSID